jgi:hypothetical protein
MRTTGLAACVTAALLNALLLGSSRVEAAAPRATFVLTAGIDALPGYYPTYLANGYWSLASTPLGTDAASSQIVAVMDRSPGDVARPAAVPSWNEIDYFDGHEWLNAAPVREASHGDYRQTLDTFDGTLTTRYRWHGASGDSDVVVSSLVSESDPHLAAVSFELTPRFDGTVRLRFTLRSPPSPRRFALARMNAEEFGAAVREANAADAAVGGRRNAIWYPGEVIVSDRRIDLGARMLSVAGRAVGGKRIELAAAIELPPGLRVLRVTRTVGSDAVGLDVEAAVRNGQRYRFVKFVAAGADGWDKPGPGAVQLARAARARGYDALRQAHLNAWHDLWRSDVEVDGNERLQTTLHSDLFYLLENTTPGAGWPAAACGFSGNYFGHVFWDNDLWVFPALLLQHPERARSLLAFRRRFLGEALARAKAMHVAGAMYPWEADPATGRDVTPAFAAENAAREIHVNGAVALAQWQYYLASGDRAWLRREGFPVMRAVADFWADRATWSAARQRFEIRDVTSPEEDYVHVNNEIYTNLVAQRSLLDAVHAARALHIAPTPRWMQVADHLYLPTIAESGRYFDFDPSTPHDKSNSWMATSVPMLSIPALDFSADGDTLQGLFQHSSTAIAPVRDHANQMVLVMLALQAAGVGRSDYFGDITGSRPGAIDPFLKPPFNVRSETPQNDSTYLLASSGGLLQSFIYGLTGLRLDENGLVARYPAVLPDEIGGLTLTGVVVRGRRGTVRLERDAGGQVVRRLQWTGREADSAPNP